MTRARDISNDQANLGGSVAPYVAGKNFAINGGFDFWQRGTSFSSAGVYTADRWYFSFGGTVTAAQESTVVQEGSTYSVKLTTGASSSFGELYNALEASEVNLLAGKTITISGYVRASAAVAYSGSAIIAVQTNTTANAQTGGTWTEQSSVGQVPSTSAWTRFSLTYAVPSGTKGLRIRLGNSAVQASGTILYWSNIQIEIGSIATPFSRAGGSIGGELALCQRYYYRWNADTTNAQYGNGFGVNTTAAYIQFQLPVPMRVPPTSLDYSGVVLGNGTSSFSGGTWASTRNHSLTPMVQYGGTSGLTANNYYQLLALSTSNYIGFTAEL